MGNTESGGDESKSEDVSVNYFNKNKTFHMKRGTNRVKKGMTLKANLMATLGGQLDMKEAVKLPPDEDLNEWFAINSSLIHLAFYLT